MSQGIPKGYILPTPRRAKLVGTLNIIFSLLIMLYIGGMIAMMVFSPAILEMSQGPIREIQAKSVKARRDEVASLKQKVAEAKSDEEKAVLTRQIDAIEKKPEPKVPDLKKIQEQMMTPGFKALTAVDLGTGLLLNIAMLVSGIGLARLKESSRKLAIWTFVLKLVRLTILLLVAIFITMPMSAKMSADMMREMQQAGANASPIPLDDMMKIQAVAGLVMAVASYLVAVVWPSIGLVLLTRPGTRAACLASASKPAASEPDFP